MAICTKCGVVVADNGISGPAVKHECLPGNLPKDRQDIIDQLNLLDLQMIRPLTENDPERVNQIIAEKIKLREKLK
jgi:hypothetical protein